MNELICHLRSFDRKERFAVLREILRFDESNFPLADDFRRKLASCIGIQSIPNEVFCATDYHLDWIEAALHLLVKEPKGNPRKIPVPSTKFNNNQRDIDLLVAFSDLSKPETTYVVLIEAKAYNYWTNKQLRKKAVRLGKIFGSDGQNYSDVRPYFVLLTNTRSAGIGGDDLNAWPDWMKTSCGKPNWLEYFLPKRRQIRRCDCAGNLATNGDYIRFDWVPK